MQRLETLIPPPVVTLAIMGLMAVSTLKSWPSYADNSTRLIIAAIIAALAIAIMLAGVWEFARARTTVNPMHPERASNLVTSGIFRFTRNPMYLGDCLLLVAWTLFFGDGFLVLGVFALAQYLTQFQIEPEERQMRKNFGAAYEDYCSQVRRWL
ncbi:MAG: isoprenylcysteine carboxylmethyltransferase family protein [Alphaproteobacteria bacterium]|nr:isoprenylcysteine carboxylmethyltransferase family protein [Alphaproteobacteria bacterium]